MLKYVEVIKKAIDLSETILEGLQYIQQLLNEGKGRQTIFMFEDVLIASEKLSASIELVFNEINDERKLEQQAEFRKTADLVVTSYEQGDYKNVRNVLEIYYIPIFEKIKNQLELELYPH